jgi:hypothetical protein
VSADVLPDASTGILLHATVDIYSHAATVDVCSDALADLCYDAVADACSDASDALRAQPPRPPLLWPSAAPTARALPNAVPPRRGQCFRPAALLALARGRATGREGLLIPWDKSGHEEASPLEELEPRHHDRKRRCVAGAGSGSRLIPVAPRDERELPDPRRLAEEQPDRGGPVRRDFRPVGGGSDVRPGGGQVGRRVEARNAQFRSPPARAPSSAEPPHPT